MFITRKSLSRRTLLKSLSATVALPFLDAMAPAASAAPVAPKRLGFVYFPNGAIMDNWIPKTSGTGFEFTGHGFFKTPTDHHAPLAGIAVPPRNRRSRWAKVVTPKNGMHTA